jgi:hypothetical protein
VDFMSRLHVCLESIHWDVITLINEMI